jgi:hypothetical protein
LEREAWQRKRQEREGTQGLWVWRDRVRTQPGSAYLWYFTARSKGMPYAATHMELRAAGRRRREKARLLK